ncbi:MAG: tetratricopeptide repeat protein [Candidatus Binatia bacterium]
MKLKHGTDRIVLSHVYGICSFRKKIGIVALISISSRGFLFSDMRKRFQKQRWKPLSTSDNSSEKPPVIQRYTNLISLVRHFIFEFGFTVLVILGLVLLASDLHRPEIILDPIEVPEDIAKLGYSGMVISEQLADAAHNIELETRELSTSQHLWTKEADNFIKIITNNYIPDITVPGAQFSLRSITRFIRQEFGLYSTYLRGELVHENDGLVLTLRNLSEPNIPAVRVFQKGKRIEQLFQEGGTALLRLTIPSVMAINAYHKLNNQLTESAAREANYTYTQAVQLFEYCLKHPPTTDDTLVLFIWGHALHFLLKKPEDAIKQYQKAIDLDPGFAEAYNTLGMALQELKRPEEAIKQYQKAIDIDPRKANVYNNWGTALHFLLKKPEEAIKQYQKAIDSDPKYAAAYNNWGNALLKLKQPEEADEKFRKAKELALEETFRRAKELRN